MIDDAQHYALPFCLTGVGVVQTDLATGRFVQANPTFCEMVGYGEGELRGVTYLELTHPDDRARDAAEFAALQRGERREGTSLTRVLRKDGQVVWLELYVTVLDEGDEAINITVVTNVTERKAAEVELADLNATLEQRVEERTQALRASEQRFSQAFYINPISACMTTFGRETFVEANNAFLTLTGYEHGEIIGKSSRELAMWSSPEDQKKLSEVERQTKGFHDRELKLRTKTGEVKDILISAEVIRLTDDDGYVKMF